MPSAMNTGTELATIRWSNAPRACSTIQSHSSASTMSRRPSPSTRAARESTTTSREPPKSRWKAKRLAVVSRSIRWANSRSRGPASPASWTSWKSRSAASSGGARFPMCW